jgi:uncharacterized protein (TIGR03084 family)
MSGLQEAVDLRDECASLTALLRTLKPEDWQRPTPFKSWTPWDVVAHLHLSDSWARASLRSPADFKAEVAALFTAIQKRVSLRDFTRERFAGVDGAALLDAWSTCLDALCADLAQTDPKARLAWFGPDMGARMFATARYMETWAHGQDIYDLLGKARVYTDSLQSIATLGVRTYEFCFRNRGQKPPEPAPYVRLVAPSGAIWEWNEPSDTHRVAGLASEFCHVVTQNRNVADTGLQAIGDSAQRWMAVAQCFAGPPENPPPPGSRK